MNMEQESVKTEMRVVNHPLTVEDRLRLGNTSAELDGQIEEVETAKKSDADRHRETLESLEAERREISSRLRSGFDPRMTECVWRMDHPERNQKHLVTVDTGRSVEVAAMTPQDRADADQLNLPGVGGNALPKKAGKNA